MAKKVNSVAIPFGKAVRFGNFKLWRSRYKCYDNEIEVLHVSSLDGAWMTRIPSTMEMYGWLCLAYGDYVSDDVERKSQGEAVLTTVLSNMLYVSSIGNGYYQRALEVCATVYAHPSLVDKKSNEYKGFLKDVKWLAESFLDWRKGYDKYVREHEPSDKELHEDEIADEALEVLNEKSED